jgi:hypothetical protein
MQRFNASVAWAATGLLISALALAACAKRAPARSSADEPQQSSEPSKVSRAHNNVKAGAKQTIGAAADAVDRGHQRFKAAADKGEESLGLRGATGRRTAPNSDSSEGPDTGSASPADGGVASPNRR